MQRNLRNRCLLGGADFVVIRSSDFITRQTVAVDGGPLNAIARGGAPSVTIVRGCNRTSEVGS
jgi:hypothetical protein